MNGAYIDIGDYSPPAVPLTELLDTYSQCLSLSRDYVENTLKAGGEAEAAEVDLEAFSQFLSARAELFALAEVSLSALAEGQRSARDSDHLTRRELTSKVVSILQELTEVEDQLSSFLKTHLRKMSETIRQMRQTQPVFKRYAHLGGPLNPSRITRHE
ncbi:MAG: hypothetical protein LBP33_07525 [Candidatus Adiutrix sp.]|jgi:hypothetical protein|nr:hypothetical protein [Candidatus Adiutrix sp.]